LSILYIKMYIWRKYSIGQPIHQTLNLYPHDVQQPRLKFLMEALEVDHHHHQLPLLINTLSSNPASGQQGTYVTASNPDSLSDICIFADYVPHYFEHLARSPSPSYVVVSASHAATTTHDTIIKK